MHFKGNHDKWIKVLQLAHTRLVHNLHSYVCVCALTENLMWPTLHCVCSGGQHT